MSCVHLFFLKKHLKTMLCLKPIHIRLNHFNSGPYILVSVATITNIVLIQSDNTLVSLFCLISFAVYPRFHDYILILRMSCVITSALIYIVIVAQLNKVLFISVEKIEKSHWIIPAYFASEHFVQRAAFLKALHINCWYDLLWKRILFMK